MEPSLLVSFLPLMIVSVIFCIFAIPISHRKGKGSLFPLLCLIPFISAFVLIYLVSLTDKEVLDRLAALEGKQR
jgi:hypothetical protein